MQQQLVSTAAALWRDSPRWRQAIWAAVGLTVLALLGRIGSPGPGYASQPGGYARAPAPPLPPTASNAAINPSPPVNQMSSLRLADFHKASVAAETLKGEGERCEARATALKALNPEDPANAQAAQKDDLQKAQSCLPQLAASDQRWRELAQAVGAAEAAPARVALQEIRTGLGRLDAFDQSRSALVRQGLPERAAKLAKALDDFDETVKALQRQVALYAASAGGSLDAANQVRELLGRLRALPQRPGPDALAPGQAEALAAGERILGEVEASEQRLLTLAQAWQRREADPQTVANLLAELGDADRARWDAGSGRPARLAAMEQAVAAQMPRVLQGLLTVYEREASRALADRILAAQALAARLHFAAPADMRGRLDKVAADVERSRVRMARLVDVEQAWNAKAPGSRNPALEQEVLAAVQASRAPGSAELNRYDAVAITEAERRAWTTLHSALAEIQGTLADPRVKLSVSVDASGIADRFLEPMPRQVAAALEAAGFVAARSPEAASIRLALSEPAIKKQREPENGGQAFALSVHARVFWVYRGSETDLGVLTGSGAGEDARAAIDVALAETARRIAEEIGARLKRGP